VKTRKEEFVSYNILCILAWESIDTHCIDT
jgi:hypothetical protein